MKSRVRIYALIASMLFGIIMNLSSSSAQTAPGRVAFGAHYGLSKYWGSFTDNQFWQGGDIFLRWNIIPWISFHGVFGISQLRYKVNEQNLADHPEYFGPPEASFYPGTTIVREEKNGIRVNTYSAIFSYNITPKQSLVPYIFGGIGMMNFEPRNLGQNVGLPNNQKGNVYDKTQLIFPVGAGVEIYVTDDFTVNAKGQINFTQTDYLDDFQDPGDTPKDIFGLFAIGASYYIFGSIDCDEDGLTDPEERRLGTDPCIIDTDGDTLTDFEEVRNYRTDPLKIDTDSDGLNDFQELRVITTDPRNPDSDNDGLNDGQEIARKTDPKNPDTDGDNLTDGDEVNTHRTDPTKGDTDGDALGDGEEITVHATNPLAIDSDGDRLNDGDEVRTHKTNPKVADTDSDGLKDGDEVNDYKTDPLKADTDNDKLTDGDEVQNVKTDPKNPDTDGDTVIDGDDRCPLIRGVPERAGCPAPPKVGTITNFPDIFFIVNTDQFDFSRPETDENLAKILAFVNQCPGLAVVIEGHASREGNDKRNQELSDMRAARVKQWLIERGIESNKIEATIGYGSRKNAVAEPDPKSKEARNMNQQDLENIRRQNRRIAIRVARTCDQE
jgi:outer membrane protein OmpA-like peptidoglycan-associated protein/opacity protein-like surface antigen